jgi:tetratricopeptide (TPR) repeat protein
MSTLTEIGKALGSSDDLSTARRIRRKLKGGGSSTVFAFIAQTQADAGKFVDALRTTDEIEAPEVRADALEWIAERQAAKGDYDGARKTLETAKILDPARRRNAVDSVLTLPAQATTGDLETARSTIAAIKSPDERSFAMIGVATSLLAAGDKAAALVWLDQALKESAAGRSNDLVSYFVIPLQVKLGQKERAMKAAGGLDGEMRVKGYMAAAVTCAEERDLACVNAAVDKMRIPAPAASSDERVSDFQVNSMLLNVTAALIANGEFELASRWISPFEERSNETFQLRTHAEFQRVFMLAQSAKFDEARRLALRMSKNSVSETERGEALRITALLETKRNGSKSAEAWALTLRDPEDRAYAILGIAQAMLNAGEAKLSYSALMMH